LKGNRATSVVLAVLAALMWGLSAPVHADSPPPGLTMEAAPAFDGYFKYGEWLPVWVQLENRGADLQAEIRARITGGVGITTFAVPVSLPTGSRKRVPLYVLANNYSHELKVELIGGDDVLLGQKMTVRPQPNNSYFVGLVAPQRGALAHIQSASLPGRERPKVLVDLPLTDLPERAEGLRSFDCLILNDIDTSALTPEQGAALASWVAQGGRLVVGGGAEAMRTVAGLPEALQPLHPQNLTEVDALPGLADFAGADAIRVPGPFVIASGQAGEGHTLAAEGALPLIRERTVGSGVVDWVALDLLASPFDAWSGTAAFWEKLLSPGASYPDWLPTDMSARQMKSSNMTYALSNLPSLDLPSIRGLGILLTVYVALVGPVNYGVLRWRKRLHWAWVTIPAITLAFSGGAFGLGYALRGTDLILNKIAIVASQPDGPASVTSYVGLFSPARQSYEIEIAGGGLLAPLDAVYNAWGPGGLSTAGEMTFLQGDPGRVRGLTINQWSMQTFMAEGLWVDLGGATGDLHLEDNSLVGVVRNELAYTLKDVVLVLGNSFVRLGDLAPGQETAVTMDLLKLNDQRFGPPLGYRLFEEAFNQAGPQGPPREVLLKQSVVDGLFQQGGQFSPLSSFKSFYGGSSLAQSPLLLGWLGEAPPDVRVAARKPSQKTTAVFYQPLDFRLADEGRVTLPPALVPGVLAEVPTEGGTCGYNVPSVYIGRGQAVFEFRLPDAARDIRIDTLNLVLGTDGGWGQPPDTSLYDWTRQSWQALQSPVFGVNALSEVAALVGEGGVVRVRLASEGSWGGCIFVELGVEGER